MIDLKTAITFIVGAIITFSTLVIAFQNIAKPFNYIKRKRQEKKERKRDWLIEPLDAKINQILEDNKELHKEVKKLGGDILQLKICSSDVPIEERLIAGHEYVDIRGLNGEVKIKYKVLQDEYEKQLKDKEER